MYVAWLIGFSDSQNDLARLCQYVSDLGLCILFALRRFRSVLCSVRLHRSVEEINPQFEGDESAEENCVGQKSYVADVCRGRQFDCVRFRCFYFQKLCFCIIGLQHKWHLHPPNVSVLRQILPDGLLWMHTVCFVFGISLFVKEYVNAPIAFPTFQIFKRQGF